MKEGLGGEGRGGKDLEEQGEEGRDEGIGGKVREVRPFQKS